MEFQAVIQSEGQPGCDGDPNTFNVVSNGDGTSNIYAPNGDYCGTVVDNQSPITQAPETTTSTTIPEKAPQLPQNSTDSSQPETPPTTQAPITTTSIVLSSTESLVTVNEKGSDGIDMVMAGSIASAGLVIGALSFALLRRNYKR